MGGLRRRYAATCLLRLWVRILPGAWMFVCCECCVLSASGLADRLISHPEELYWLWCVNVCDLETLWMRRPWPTGGCCAKSKQTRWGWVVSAMPQLLYTQERETQYSFYRWLCGPQGRSGWVPKICLLPGFKSWTIQPVASRCTSYAILAHISLCRQDIGY
jgi:hypothetical protein